MASNAFWAYGSLLQLGNGATPEVFSTIAEVRDITPPPMERDTIDVTSHDSTGGWKEYIGGWRDGGEVEFECNWLPTNTTQDGVSGLLATFADNVTHNWKIVLPNAIATVTFAAFLSKYEPDLPIEEQGMLKVTLKVSGAVTVS